ncbi:MAG: PDDEXK nuclease domain-containing protein [Muribaculaceae bacterium]|nr:PDDEXK nuclease domain-containing protein [Muribaculaceae bacterium]
MTRSSNIQQKETDYSNAINTIKDAILRSQYHAAKLINREMLSLYYGIGKYISANSRRGFWGTGAIKTISERLQKDLPGLKGFSQTNLKYMRLFYEEWSPILETIESNSSATADKIETNSLLPQKSSTMADDFESFFNLSFSHHIIILIEEKDIEKRWKYIYLATENKWNKRFLKAQINEKVADHYGKLPSNFSDTIKNSREAFKALNMFKDEYMLDFINTEEIGIRDIADIDERVVEKEIIHNIKNFIMTFGRDFAFVGNQYHLEAFSEDFFPDLLFFNRELNCLVVVELKTGNFKPGYLAQLMTYLRILDDKVKKPHENPSIGIVLCKEANKEFVEYVFQDYAKPMGVATYRFSKDMPDELRKTLPDVEDLKKLL